MRRRRRSCSRRTVSLPDVCKMPGCHFQLLASIGRRGIAIVLPTVAFVAASLQFRQVFGRPRTADQWVPETHRRY